MSELDLCPVCQFPRKLPMSEVQPGSGGMTIYPLCQCGLSSKTLKEAAEKRLASYLSEIARLEAWIASVSSTNQQQPGQPPNTQQPAQAGQEQAASGEQQ